MSTPSRSSGVCAQDIQSPDTYLSATAENALVDDQKPYISPNDAISLFQNPTAVSTAVLRSRAVEIRDILSTFSRDEFPSEYIKANIFDRISFLEGPKAIEDCVEKEDLVSTVFLLAVNNCAQYRLLRHALPKDVCALHFQQKLQRRINTQIQAFDVLDIAARSTDPPDQDYIRTRVGTIAAELNHITKIIKDDRQSRLQGEAETASHLVYIMQAVCHRNYRPGKPSASRQKFGGNHNSNLFYILFGNTKNREARFGLDALKAFSKEAMMPHYEGLNIIRRLIVENDISPDYVIEFDEITGISMQ